MRVAVLASGRGSNLEALIDAQRSGRIHAELVVVASDKRRAGALQIAAEAGIETIVLSPRDFDTRAAFDLALFARVAEYHPDLIVLAGYMRIVDSAALAAWQGRIINIHPSLLPKYPGLDTHQRAIDAGDMEHGASVHYVTAELDGGPVIAQTRLPIQSDDTSESLAVRLLPMEHELLVSTVEKLGANRQQENR
ncbi:MAG: phosphoribosylglycinamide formyltransferase [Dokdonella sp.]